MANELIYSGDPATDSGLTITGKVYDTTGTQVGGSVTMTEVGVLAIYRGDMPTADAGKYYVRFDDTGTLKDQFIFYWDGTAEVNVQTIDAAITALEGELKIAVEDAALIVR